MSTRLPPRQREVQTPETRKLSPDASPGSDVSPIAQRLTLVAALLVVATVITAMIVVLNRPAPDRDVNTGYAFGPGGRAMPGQLPTEAPDEVPPGARWVEPDDTQAPDDAEPVIRPRPETPDDAGPDAAPTGDPEDRTSGADDDPRPTEPDTDSDPGTATDADADAINEASLRDWLERAGLGDEADGEIDLAAIAVWPANETGQTFRFATANDPVIAFGPEGAPVETSPTRHGAARLSHAGALDVAGGWVHFGKGASHVMRRAAQADAFAMSLVLRLGEITPSLEADAPAPVVWVLALTDPSGEALVLGQRGRALLLRTPGSNDWVELVTPPIGPYVQLAVSLEGRQGRAYLNGRGETRFTLDQPVASWDDRADWMDALLLLGGREGGGRGWSGTIEGLLLASRAKPAMESAMDFLGYRQRLARRDRPARYTVRAELIRASLPPDDLADAPAEALIVHEYQVTEVLAASRGVAGEPAPGDDAAAPGSEPEGEPEVDADALAEDPAGDAPEAEALPAEVEDDVAPGLAVGDRITVAHWARLDGELRDAAQRMPGETFELTLEPFDANPQLMDVPTWNGLGPDDPPRFYDRGQFD